MKKMMVILILVALLSGCVGKERTYKDSPNSSDYLTLKPDGTYELYARGYLWTGEYEEDKDSVILKLSPPLPSIRYQKSEKKLISEHDVLILQE